MRYLRIGILSLMAGLGSLACSGEAGPSEGSGAPALANPNDNAKVDERVQGDPNERLDDFQIATVLHVVNVGEIREARFAQQRAERADVRDFASRMEMEHMKVDEELRALFGDADHPHAAPAEGNPPPDDEFPTAPSRVSRLLERQTVLDLQLLRPIAPPDFDLGYITKQVAAHAGALGIINQMLLPDVEMTELRQLIERVQPAVTMHLQHATGITQTIIGPTRN